MNAILKTENLSISFGGHTAVDAVSLEILQNQFTSIIGPNGAGKTTFFNLLSGQLSPTAGRIFYKDKEITKLSPTERTRMGIGRSFQITNVFPNLTVLENVRLAVQSQEKVRYNMTSHFLSFKRFEDKAKEYLEQVFLQDKANFKALNLAHGEKRKLEIAMLLALESEVLLLDEPTAGMALEEVPAIIEVIQGIKQLKKQTLVLIEHKMDMIIDLSDEIVVLYHGEMLAKGKPAEIVNNEVVQSAYLGGMHNDRLHTQA